MNSQHVGEGGKHYAHTLELREDGRVRCLTCDRTLGWKTVEVAWPENSIQPDTRASHPSHAAVEAMAQALEKARPILESELQSMCKSYCPPCKEGDVFDYSKLKQPELGWITATEEALDNTDAALDAYRATQKVRP